MPLSLAKSSYNQIFNNKRPTNYHDINDVDQEILNLQHANGDNRCFLINPISKDCTIGQIGDKPSRICGFRNPVDGIWLQDIGAIDLIVNTWINSR
jgi:hypothetical protein